MPIASTLSVRQQTWALGIDHYLWATLEWTLKHLGRHVICSRRSKVQGLGFQDQQHASWHQDCTWPLTNPKAPLIRIHLCLYTICYIPGNVHACIYTHSMCVCESILSCLTQRSNSGHSPLLPQVERQTKVCQLQSQRVSIAEQHILCRRGQQGRQQTVGGVRGEGQVKAGEVSSGCVHTPVRTRHGRARHDRARHGMAGHGMA